MKAVIPARVSSREQEMEQSIDAQLENMKSMPSAKNYRY